MIPVETTSRWRRQSTGMTLTEVVVGAALLVIAIVPILRALTIAQRASVTMDRKTQCLILAQAKLDEIRARSVHHYDDSFREDSQALAEAFLCTITDDSDPTLRLVTVSVGYDGDVNGRLAEAEVGVKLATYLAKRQ